MPGTVVRFVTGVRQLARQAVGVAVKTGGDMAERNHAGAGESGDIDHTGRIKTFGVGQRIVEDQAAFGVGVQNLHGLARHAGDNVAWLGGGAARHVFRCRHQADDIELELERSGGLEGA